MVDFASFDVTSKLFRTETTLSVNPNNFSNQFIFSLFKSVDFLKNIIENRTKGSMENYETANNKIKKKLSQKF